MPTTSPGLDAVVLQRVGEALDVAQEVVVGDVALLALLAAPVEGDALAEAVLDVAVQAVVGRVELAVLEPLVERRVGVVEDLLEVREPVQGPRLLGPPALEVLGGLLVLGEVGDQRRRRRSPPAGRSAPDRGGRPAPARGSCSGCPPCPLLSRSALTRPYPNHAAPTSLPSARRDRCQRFSGRHGHDDAAERAFVTAANDAYHAASAVARPTQPPSLMMFVCAPALPMPSRKNVTASSTKTGRRPRSCAATAMNMYVVKMPHAMRNRPTA